MSAAPVARPIPIPRAILWAPAGGAEARMPGYPVFIEQSALQALQEHHRASPDQGLLGFLVGDLCRDPETRVGYVVIDTTIRLNQAIVGDKTGVVVAKLWDRVQPQLQEVGGQLVGWYHSHPPQGPAPAAGDQETHLMYFTQPWQVAVVLARDGNDPVAGLFRPTRDPASAKTPLPFYELVPEAALEGAVAKGSVLEWTNYRTEARVSRGPTPQVVRPKIPKAFTPRRPAPPPAKLPAPVAPEAPPQPTPKAPPKAPPKAEPPRPSRPPSVRLPEPSDTIETDLLGLLDRTDAPAPKARAKAPPPPPDDLPIERASDPSSAAPPPPPPPPPAPRPPSAPPRPRAPAPPAAKRPEERTPEEKKPAPEKPEPKPSRRPVRPKAIADLPLLVEMDEVEEEEPAAPAPPPRPPPPPPSPEELLRLELDRAFEEEPRPPAGQPRALHHPDEPPPALLMGSDDAAGRPARLWPAILAVMVVFGTVGAAIALKGKFTRGREASEPPPSRAAPRLPARPAPARPARPAPAALAPARTGFIAGGGQRGRIGSRLPEPLVFEVRDAANRLVHGQAVAFASVNATLDPALGVTDSTGRLRAVVTLGPRAQPTVITATVGALERQVTVTAVPGPAARIAVFCGREPVAGRLTLAPGSPVVLRLGVEDAGGNALVVSGLRVAVGDERVLRVAATAAQGNAGTVTLRPAREGATSLAVLASGLQENVAATVARNGSRCQ